MLFSPPKQLLPQCKAFSIDLATTHNTLYIYIVYQLYGIIFIIITFQSKSASIPKLTTLHSSCISCSVHSTLLSLRHFEIEDNRQTELTAACVNYHCKRQSVQQNVISFSVLNLFHWGTAIAKSFQKSSETKCTRRLVLII